MNNQLKPNNDDYVEAMKQLKAELNGHEPYAAHVHERARVLARKKMLKLVK